MSLKQSKSDRIFDAVNVCIMCLVLCVTLYPLIYVLSASISYPEAVMRGEIVLLPKGLSLLSYSKVFENNAIWMGYINSILYTLAGTLVNLVMTFFGAYPLSKKTCGVAKLSR